MSNSLRAVSGLVAHAAQRTLQMTADLPIALGFAQRFYVARLPLSSRVRGLLFHPAPSPLRSAPSDDDRRRELAAFDREVTRGVRWLYVQTIAGCLLCGGLGVFLIGWALHTTDPSWGAIALWSGLLIGDAGTLLLLIRHYRRSTERGF